MPDDGTIGTTTQSAFQVDLRGVVELLSHHLYSGPRVYVREVVQNAVDAVTVRDARDDRPALLLVPADVSADGRLHAMDSGVGLDEDDVRTFLATIGRSSKRDELGLARSDLLGRFGIGLLSCFMVTDAIEVVSRRGDRGDEPPVRWVGEADGTYRLQSWAAGGQMDDERADWLAAGPGTCVALAPRRGSEHLLSSASVVELARHYGAYLPHRVVVRTPDGDVEVSGETPPWRVPDPERRRDACVRLAEAELGGTPFHVLPIRVPEAGLDGVAVIAGQRSSSARHGRHRVHLKGMLLSDQVPDLVPEWAFFVRCAVDAELLRPTADREGLVEDDLLEHVRTSIGEQVRAWLVRLAATQPHRLREFLSLHDTAVKALALHDDELLRIVLPLLPFETNQGVTTLPELLATTDVVRVTQSIDDFRQVGAVLAAQGVAVVNGGYTFDLALVHRLVDVRPDAVVERVTPTDVEGHVRFVGEERAREVASALDEIRAVLDAVQVDVELRSYAPATLPALLVEDDAAHDRREVRAVAAEVDDAWGALLGAFDDGGSDRPRLLLNDANPAVRRVLALDDATLRGLAAETLYGRALLAAPRRLRPADSALLDRSFNALLDRAVATVTPAIETPATETSATDPEGTTR